MSERVPTIFEAYEAVLMDLRERRAILSSIIAYLEHYRDSTQRPQNVALVTVKPDVMRMLEGWRPQ